MGIASMMAYGGDAAGIPVTAGRRGPQPALYRAPEARSDAHLGLPLV
jgi:hypothetical protein